MHLTKNNESINLGRTSRISKKKMENLIFHFNDSQSDSESESTKDYMHSSTSKIERFKDIKGTSAHKIMPSIMQANYQQDNYLFQTPQPAKNKCKIKTRKTLFDFKIVEDDDQTIQKVNQKKEQQNYMKNEKIQNQNQQIKQQQISNKSVQNPQKCQNDQIQKIDQLQELDSCHISLFNTNNNKKPDQTMPQPLNIQTQLIFNLQSDQQQRDQTNNVHQNMTTCGDQQIAPQIIKMSTKTSQLSSQLSQKIGNFESAHNIRIFLSTPIPQDVIFTFEIHKYKNFMKTQYNLLLQHGQHLTLFATATNDKIYIQKSVFILNLAPKSKSQMNQWGQDLFIGKFVSDFKRENYTLYDHANQNKPNGTSDKVLCTISTVINFVHPKLVCQQIYTPVVVNKQPSIILNNSLCKNLKKLFALKQCKSMLNKYTTHPISQKTLQQMREQFKVSKNTTRHALIKNQNGQIKMVFLKMQNNRFKIRAGSGITPLQIFCYGIVHLQ